MAIRAGSVQSSPSLLVQSIKYTHGDPGSKNLTFISAVNVVAESRVAYNWLNTDDIVPVRKVYVDLLHAI